MKKRRKEEKQHDALAPPPMVDAPVIEKVFIGWKFPRSSTPDATLSVLEVASGALADRSLFAVLQSLQNIKK